MGFRPVKPEKGIKMSLGLVGRKVGMTRVFTDDGDSIPVTVVDVSNNRVTQIKTPDTTVIQRAGRVRQTPREPREQSCSRSFRESGRRSWSHSA
jgi:ribosomal protein L3